MADIKIKCIHFAYHDIISPEILQIGKKIERKHLTFRTRLKRLARPNICFPNLFTFIKL